MVFGSWCLAQGGDFFLMLVHVHVGFVGGFLCWEFRTALWTVGAELVRVGSSWQLNRKLFSTEVEW